MSIVFTSWELLYLQQCATRWFQNTAKGPANFSVNAHALITSIKAKVQVADGTPVNFTEEENEFLQSLFRWGQEQYGMPSGNWDWVGAREQVRQRSVYVAAAVLAKLRNEPVPEAPNETDQSEAVD